MIVLESNGTPWELMINMDEKVLFFSIWDSDDAKIGAKLEAINRKGDFNDVNSSIPELIEYNFSSYIV